VAEQSRDPFQVLIACILSLRTQDATTGPAAERLFALAGTPDQARTQLSAWVAAGLDTPIALPIGETDPIEQIQLIAAELGPWLKALP